MRRGFVTVATALVIMTVMTTAFLTGVKFAHQDSQGYVIDGTPVPTQLQQPLNDLWQGYQHLNSDSYWRPFKDQKQLFYDAIDGMLSTATAPQDSHTIFIEPVTNQGVSTSLQEGLFGIGAQVTKTNDGGLVIEPLVDSPADKAGLHAGDVIIKVDGKDIRKMKSDAAVNLIRGQQGTVVKLTIERPGVARPFVVAVTRGTIPSVLPGQFGSVGYIGFHEFDVNTASEVHSALKELLAKHIASLIIDLRDNGGGYVDTARDIASEFLPRNAVIYWERNNVNGKKVDTATRVTAPGIGQKLPIAVLANGNTASAAEILTAALREHGRATVIGTTTFGKGSVQEDLGLPDGSALRITIRLWLTPHKNWVQNGGITPDIAINPGTNTAGQDVQIARALQYLSNAH